MSTPLQTTINEENIEQLVRAFYPRVLKDSVLSPFFIEKLGSNIGSAAWEEHLQLITHFWQFVALGDDQYNRSPLVPHFDIAGINKEAFAQWLILFHCTVDEIYSPSSGKYFKEKSTNIAENFMRKLNL